KYTGYIPGFGIIDQEAPVRVLSSIQSQSRDGIQLKIVSAIIGTENTAIIYSLKGIPTDTFEGNAPLTPNNQRCDNGVWLELPNGERISSLGSGSLGYGEDNDYQKIAFFTPISGDVNEIAFRMDCIEGTYPDQAPENWSISIALKEATDLQAFPILKAQSNTWDQTKNSIMISGLIPFEEKFIVLGRYIPNHEGVLNLSLTDVSFLDVNGNHLPYNIPGEFQYYSNEVDGRFAYIIDANSSSFPIAMQIGRITYSCWGNAPIEIALTDVPPDNKDYEVRQSLNLGDCRMDLVSLRNSGTKLTLRFKVDGQKINYVSVRDVNDPKGEVTSNRIQGQAFVELSPIGLTNSQKIYLVVEGVELESIDPVSALIEIQDYQ
ncbi:MAG: hypothetical protein ACYDHA_13175, partial [Bellilinea sp.]